MREIFSAQNNAVATIQNCAEEPIHIPGSIQPHGFLLVIDAGEMIALCSQNAEQYLNKPNTELLSKHYSEVLPENLVAIIRDYLTTGKKNLMVPQSVLINELFDCFFREANQELFIVECVVTTETANTMYDTLEQTNELVSLINQQKTNLQELCQLITRKIHEIIGYDRVMVYRFDEMYNGNIFAETVVPGHESFLGLHYPHTDIPVQARALYIKNLMRLIADVEYTPVPVITLEKALAEPHRVDMSNAHLRSVSPIHIQYLKNIGVKGTFTISLLKNGKLWGLIACHHYATGHLSFARQMQAFLQAQILSSQIAVHETSEKYDLSVALDVPLKILLDTLARESNFKERFFEHLPQILQVVNATGAVLIGRKQTYYNGHTPTQEQIDQLHTWLLNKNVEQFHTHKLSTLYPPASDFQEAASGILFFKIPLSQSQNTVLFFRTSQNKVIKWGGEVNTKEGIEALTPRNSFATWQQIIEGESMEWMEAEIQAGFHFIYGLQGNIFRQYLREEEISIRQLNDKLVKANKELENINWISSHDLKEPLRKILMFTSMIKSEDSSKELIATSIEKIQRSASRMQRLIEDLMLYSKMSSGDASFETIDLNELLPEVLKTFEDEIADGMVQLTFGNLPTLQGNRFQLQQLFINLFSNSVKFRKRGTQQQIRVQAEKESHYLKVSVCDDGMGFAQELKDKIFNIFQRGHSYADIEGTGIGLAICRKIMENHSGYIKAIAQPNEGACFYLYFPLGGS